MNPSEFLTLARAEQELWWFQGMQKMLFRLLDPIAGARRFPRVLEAGCGTGFFSRLLERRYGWKMFPADLAWEGLKYARVGGTERLAQADIAALPYRSSSFSALLSLDVLVHFPRGAESTAVREFARVLERKGLLVIRVSALDALRSRHSEFTHERQRFTRRRLAELARAHGFHVLRCTYANSLLLPVALAKFRIWEPLFRKPPASGTAPLPPWLNRLLYAPLALESWLIARGVNFPAGQSLILIGEKE